MPFFKLAGAVFGSICALSIASCAPQHFPAKAAVSSDAPPPISVVPRPRMVRTVAGGFQWPKRVAVEASSAPERRIAEMLAQFASTKGIAATIRAGQPSDVRLRILPHADVRLGSEGYILDAGAGGVNVRANSAAGLFYGLQTLEQLSAPQNGGLYTGGIAVVDWPALRWRGIHLDVARHFFGPAVVKRYIALAAHYKLNTFHWHLTDDQAWRLQIAGYPRFTAPGSFYTQAQIRDIVAYASARFVTVVPEIEMPGHSTAATNAYPAYANSAPFVRTILAQVFALFPGAYVHLGGDEVTYTARRARFMRSLEQYARGHGRRVVGWDETLQAGLSRSAVVMSWRGERAAVSALARGYDTVMTPDGPLYFDAYQGNMREEPRASRHMSTLEEVYAYDPLPDAAPPGTRSHLLGVQANVWTERIATRDHLYYMLLPRELALSEIAWLPPRLKNWNKFLAALPAQFAWLDRNGYSYRVPNPAFEMLSPAVFAAVRGNVQAAFAMTAASRAALRIVVPLEGATIRYTTDGSVPSSASPRSGTTLHLALSLGQRIRVRAVAYTANGRASSVSECIVQRVEPLALRARRGYSRSWAGLVSP